MRLSSSVIIKLHRRIKYSGIFILGFLLLSSCDGGKENKITWKLDSTSEIAGNAVTLSGSPKITEEGVIEFDGQQDGLLIDRNPISGMEEFTIEVEIKPYSGYPENREQRFLHIQDPENDDRRILIELRLNDREEWYGDWYMKTGNEALTLIDTTLTHPVNEWATIALTYKDGTMTGSINGKQELSGEIQYLPIGESAKISIGTRMDQRSWYKGAIKEVRFKEGTLN